MVYVPLAFTGRNLLLTAMVPHGSHYFDDLNESSPEDINYQYEHAFRTIVITFEADSPWESRLLFNILQPLCAVERSTSHHQGREKKTRDDQESFGDFDDDVSDLTSVGESEQSGMLAHEQPRGQPTRYRPIRREAPISKLQRPSESNDDHRLPEMKPQRPLKSLRRSLSKANDEPLCPQSTGRRLDDQSSWGRTSFDTRGSSLSSEASSISSESRSPLPLFDLPSELPQRRRLSAVEYGPGLSAKLNGLRLASAVEVSSEVWTRCVSECVCPCMWGVGAS